MRKSLIEPLVINLAAIVAVTVLLFWHLYNVHFRPGKFPVSALWLTGNITGKEMKEEHPAETLP